MGKIVVVRRPTRLDALVARFNTKRQARFYVERLGADFSDYEREHADYYRALGELEKACGTLLKVQSIDWRHLPNFLFAPDDLVATMGQDGLVANAMKYLDGQTVVGFNPDPGRWDGVLSQFSAEEARGAAEAVLRGTARIAAITKAKAELSDGQVLYAVNDFFVGVKNHSSARYRISSGGASERQSSSGVIVSTPLGASGWMRSVLAGAAGIAGRRSGRGARAAGAAGQDGAVGGTGRDWGSDRLTFAVREPFPSVSTGTDLVFGEVAADGSLEIESLMGENGIVFSDGIQDDFLDFNYSVRARISVAPAKGRLAVRG